MIKTQKTLGLPGNNAEKWLMSRRCAHLENSTGFLSLKSWLAILSLWALVLLPAHAAASLTAAELREQIGKNLTRVEEFAFIREQAKKLGIKAYLGGGTAAGFAHYARWNALREKGDPAFQAERFDFDYTNIYHSTQDLDIIVDGPADKAKALESILQSRYRHFQGNRSAWEVRLLREDVGDKLALLDNPDFLGQHTDSNSTSLIEITEPTKGDPLVRDLRDWNNPKPAILEDVAKGEIRYYFSPKHGKTLFAKEGRNPPILSVIRYLTKAFQYGLEIPKDDKKIIRKIIADFDPQKDLQNSYVQNWLLKKEYGRKLIKNAQNMEKAYDTLDRLGLREKLIRADRSSKEIDSLAWWMSREPLRSFQVGTGKGQTAAQMGITNVAHETANYAAYESISRAPNGDANVLSSGGMRAGERAVHGDGFYTKVGNQGAANSSGITLRFTLDPAAREGTDFTYVPKLQYVVVQNKAALKLIPESLNMSPVEFARLLMSGEWAESDIQFEKLRRRVANKFSGMSDDEVAQIGQMLKRRGSEKRRITGFRSVGGTGKQELIKFIGGNHGDVRLYGLLEGLLASKQAGIAPTVASAPFCAHSEKCRAYLKKFIDDFPSSIDKISGDQLRKDFKNIFARPDLHEFKDILRYASQKKNSAIVELLFRDVFPQLATADFDSEIAEALRFRPKGSFDDELAHVITRFFGWRNPALIPREALAELIESATPQELGVFREIFHPRVIEAAKPEFAAFLAKANSNDIKDLLVWNYSHGKPLSTSFAAQRQKQLFLSLLKEFARRLEGPSSPAILAKKAELIKAGFDPEFAESMAQGLARLSDPKSTFAKESGLSLIKWNSLLFEGEEGKRIQAALYKPLAELEKFLADVPDLTPATAAKAPFCEKGFASLAP